MLRWLKASLAAPNTTISSGSRAARDRRLEALQVRRQHRVAHAGLAPDAGHHLRVVGHLRHPLRADEAGDLDLAQARRPAAGARARSCRRPATGCFSFCSPSRGPTSTSLTRVGSFMVICSVVVAQMSVVRADRDRPRRRRALRAPARGSCRRSARRVSSRRVRAEPCGVTVIFGWRQNGCSAGSGSACEHVERGARQLAAVEQRDQVVVDQMRAARHVDDVAAGGCRAATACRGSGCRASSASAAAGTPARGWPPRKSSKLPLAGEAAHAVDGLGRAAPAEDRELELRAPPAPRARRARPGPSRRPRSPRARAACGSSSAPARASAS